ncbi:MAG: sugar kinase [Acidimicrobiia bacterium]|nr:sugar kinase [Acidimicrobiia bacterium]
MSLTIRPAQDCLWDCVSLGEVMIRLDPGDVPTRVARHFQVWEGGGEYNVSRGLRRCFGKRTTVVTAIVDNEIGRLLEDLILQGGVDMRHVQWVDFDGVGKRARNGLNFTERGYGARAAKGCSDRGHTATSLLQPGQVDWQQIFETEGARWLHTGGIVAGLGEQTPDVVLEAMQAAHASGTIVSYDLNYRPSLWEDHGGKARAQEVNRELAHHVDVMIGNEEDFSAALGYPIEGVGDDLMHLDPTAFGAMIQRVTADYPNLQGVGTTLRGVRSASRNDWGAVLWADGSLYEATHRPNLEIFDRVGGGDSFASGLIYGLLEGKTPQECVEYGAAHGALAMTTPGDTTMATLADVERVVKGGAARVTR